MTERHRLGDRRDALRLETTGELWAALDVTATAILRNIAMRGALVEAQITMDVTHLREATIRLTSTGPDLSGVVRHVRPAPPAAGEDRYLLGIEFVGLSDLDRVRLQQYIRDFGHPSIEI